MSFWATPTPCGLYSSRTAIVGTGWVKRRVSAVMAVCADARPGLSSNRVVVRERDPRGSRVRISHDVDHRPGLPEAAARSSAGGANFDDDAGASAGFKKEIPV